jgi:hypothetical protein
MNRAKLAGLALGIGAAAAGGLALLAPIVHAAAPAARTAARTEPAPASREVDPLLRPPAGYRLSADLKGTGVQVYQCTAAGSWTFLEPDATLADRERTVALHTRGPVWNSTVDGSAVAASPVPGASVAHHDAVPELLLKATSNRGEGVFGRVAFVQRLGTHGGLAPTGACAAGSQVGVPYTADYRFFVPDGGR